MAKGKGAMVNKTLQRVNNQSGRQNKYSIIESDQRENKSTVLRTPFRGCLERKGQTEKLSLLFYQCVITTRTAQI
jgi:hypothetical protein